ncbi:MULTISPECIES: Wzz/FepE/Etk N-terminal domain-containing protein [Dysgonomonas]|uniref:Polysaccharide chain length determinant N-terminal domain-containing protein n=1 Tax=Dysgonomonas gadei ATCC BAA-286 TaxID=742766 RepID=F5IUQ8_9BACT|nr:MULTISPECIES: Wzz/FepE/Etk N-terminal domain-containing protein [Dysgonomonas]EGK02958.1 hypothetical protein HMPREF9455_01208 [Dysgonomonas gadei ATCC BAA-286]MBF0648783.1 chain-length determining protein [Dysgonomonas sp. GY75]
MEEKKNNITEDKEIDLLELASKLWKNKKFILKMLSVGVILGLIVALSKPKEFTTTVLLLPASNEASGGKMGSLAALAGIDLNGTTDVISTDIYPNIIQSTPFIQGLYNINVKDLDEGVNTTLYDYIENHQQTAWWSYILGLPSFLSGMFSSSDSNPSDSIGVNNQTFISKDEIVVIGSLRDRLEIKSDKNTSLTSISVTMQSSQISAFVADTLTSYMQGYIIDYRTQKARKDLIYAEKLYKESKENYYQAQKNLAVFIDGNMNVVSARFKTTQEQLQNEANLAYSLYNQMAQQLQMAKVKVQDKTPVFTIIQPVVQPIEPSGLSKKMVLAIFVFLAFSCAVLWILKDDLFDFAKK